jgi:hypothetical protein
MNYAKEKMMLNAIDKKVLKEVADLEGLPKGAYNIRKNGKLEGREVSANINIETNEKGDGIVIDIKPGTKNESVHIPVILSQAGLHDVVYNTFIIGEGSDVTIVAGCGIHCGSDESEAIPASMNFTSRPAQRSPMLKNILPLAKAAANAS